MKYLFAALAVCAFLAWSPAQSAEAKGVIVYSAGDAIDLVEDLPDTLHAEIGLPEQVDIGWMHFKFTLFWMPFFGSPEGQYVLYKDDTYYELTAEEAQQIAALAGRELPEVYSPPFYTQYWGWAVALLLIGGYIGYGRLSKG